jgi:oligopeptide transport system ATP-binding protein
MSEVLLEVSDLNVTFGTRVAVRDASFELHAGETLGVVGESGAGKSTLARAVLRLVAAASGRIVWRGMDLLACGTAELRAQRRDLAIVFQNPLASLNPRMRVAEIVAEPSRIFERSLDAATHRRRAESMLERVGLRAALGRRYPHELSGGECQRVAIARAMILRPKLLVCDEPVSSLDVSIQGQIVNLLRDLQREEGTAMLFISHNLAVIRHVCHRVSVMYAGSLVETASRDALFASPRHPHTRALLAAAHAHGPARARPP